MSKHEEPHSQLFWNVTCMEYLPLLLDVSIGEQALPGKSFPWQMIASLSEISSMTMPKAKALCLLLWDQFPHPVGQCSHSGLISRQLVFSHGRMWNSWEEKEPSRVRSEESWERLSNLVSSPRTLGMSRQGRGGDGQPRMHPPQCCDSKWN